MISAGDELRGAFREAMVKGSDIVEEALSNHTPRTLNISDFPSSVSPAVSAQYTHSRP